MYLQNQDVGMTRTHYIEMCEMMGDPIVEEDLPWEFEDFPHEVQTSIIVYSYLRDIWDGMSGSYMGKDMSVLFDIFDLLEVDKTDQKLVFKFLKIIDSVRSKIIDNKREKPSK